MATYQGYTGKQKFGLSTSAVSAYAKAKQDEMDQKAADDLEKQREAQQQAQNVQQGKNADGSKKSLLEKAKDLGKGIIGGAEQGVGLLGDVAIEGGGLLGTIGKGSSDQKKALDAAQALRDKLHGVKDINGTSLGGTSDVDEAATRIANGEGSARDIAAVGGKGLEAGLAATQFINPTNLAANAVKGATGRELGKDLVTSSLGLGGTAGVQTGLQDIGEGKGLGESAKDALKTAAVSTATNAAFGALGIGAGKFIGKAEGKTGAAADVVDKEVAQGAETAAKPLSLQSGLRSSEDVSNDIQRVQNGEFTPEDNVYKDTSASGNAEQVIDPAKVKAKFKDLQDELQASQSYETNLKQAGIDDSTPKRSVDEVDAEAQALNDGKYDDSYYDAPKNVSSAEEIALHENLPEPLKQAGNLLATDKAYAQQQLSQVLTPESGQDILKSLDEQYTADLKKLEGLPEARAKDQTEKITQDYLDQVNEIEDVIKQDAPEAKKAQDTLDAIKEKEKALVSDVNGFQADYFDDFKSLNQERVNTRLAELEAERGQANSSLTAKNAISDAAETGDFNEIATATPENIDATREEVVQNFDNYKQSSPVVQALNRIMSPSRVFEAMGLRDLHTKIFQASGKMIKANDADLKTIKEVAKSLDGNKDLASSVIDYLEGKTDTLATGNKELADKIKSFFDTKGDALKKMGYATREEYFPHIFDKNDKSVQRLFGNKATGTVNFGNLKERTTEGGDFSRDVIAVMSKYAQGFNKKVYLEPALKPLESLRTQAELTNSETRFVNDYLNQLQNKNRSGVEEGINGVIDSLYGKDSKKFGDNHLRKALGAQRMVSAVATMGGNVSTVVRNMSQMVNTGATLNPKWATAGMMDALRTLPNRKSELFKELQDSGIFEGGVSKNYNIDMNDLSVGGKAAEAAKTGVDLLMSGVRASDVLLRTQAYLGARAKHLAKNPGDIEGAKAKAIESVIDTQFVTSNIDNAVALNGPMVRSLTQLATFSVKQAEYLGHLGVDIVKKDANGNYGFANAAAAGKALTFVMGAGLTVSALGPVIGMKPQEFIPFADQFSSGSLYRSPLVAVLFGDGKSKQGLTSTVAQTFDPSQRDNPDESTGDVWSKFWGDNWSSLVPAGSQIKKSTEGLDAANSGQSVNASGKTRFLQSTDDGTKLQSLLFGQYATKAGQDWVNSGMNTLSDKQTQQLQGLSTEKQKQYYDYYQAAKNTTGRDDAVAAIKDAAKSGDQNKAIRLGEEYNAKVTKAMATYWTTNTSLPERLQDDMTSTLYIDTQKTLDSLNTKKSSATIQKENAYNADDQEE